MDKSNAFLTTLRARKEELRRTNQYSKDVLEQPIDITEDMIRPLSIEKDDLR